MIKKILFLALLQGFVFSLHSQCFQIMDGNGNPSSNPYFINCAPGTYTVFIQPDQALGPYTIDWGDGTPNSTGSSLVPPAFESHVYAAATDTFILSITSGSCTINGVVVQERNPLASIQLPSGDDNFGCTPVSFRYINSSTQISQTTDFVWDFGDGSPIESYDHTNLGDTLTHTYLPGIGVQSCDLEVTLTATNYCGSSQASFFPVKVWDLDEARITPSATLLCYPDTVVSYVNSTIRNCYPEGNQSQRYEYWNFGDYWGLGYDSIIQWRPWNPPIINPPPIAYPGVGTYFVTLLDSSFCGIDDVTISITITNPPLADISSDKDTICAGEQVRFFNNSSGGANVYSWNFGQGAGWQSLGSGNQLRTFNNPGNYSIRLAVGISGAQGCFDTASVDLVVNPGPVTGFSTNPTEDCDSLLTSITNTTSGSATVYRWDFGNSNTHIGQNPPDQFYPSPGTYTISLYAENTTGCNDSVSKDVIVRESPLADFSVNSVCIGQQAVFTDLSTYGNESITSWKWYFGDGDSSSLQNPTHVYNSFGNFDVVLIVSTTYCTDRDTLNLLVEPPPTAAYTTNVDEGCSGLTVNFTNTSSNNAATFQWNFGDGSAIVTTQHASHTFVNNGTNDTTFIVQLLAQTAFGCSDTIRDTITVYPVPVPDFSSNAILECGPTTVDFNNLTKGNNLTYVWDFGDGSARVTDTNPTHVFENKTLFISNYTVSLIVVSQNGCSDTTTDIVTVYPEPIFNFTSVPDSGCSPLKVSFPSVVGAVNYQWDFGDGNTASGPTPNHTYVNNTTNDLTFVVQLIAQSSFGCVDTTYGSVLVYPNPVSNFALDTNKGCQPLALQITNTTTGANSYHWDFGDGSTSDTSAASFARNFVNTSQLSLFNTIQLIAETDKGCMDTSTRVIEVHPYIEAGFVSDSVGCSPLPVNFSNQSIGAASYQWWFGDGANSSATNPQHIYTNNTASNQLFLSKLIAVSTQGCIDSVEKPILVYPKPTADFATNADEGCHPLNVVFNNSSLLSDSCSWIFGDGQSISGCNPTYAHFYGNTTSFFPIDYISELRVFSVNGCSDTLKKNINVKPEVIADFASDSVGCSPLKINFQNQSVGGSTYEWTFGDGGGEPGANPSHFFINTAYRDTVFKSQLIVTSSYNCKDTAYKDILIHPKPLADFSTDVNAGCQPLPVNFNNSSIIADSCRWSFGDGTFLSDCSGQVSHTYTNAVSLVPANYKAELMVYTNDGCADSLSQNIEVSPQVIADFSMDTVGCSPLAITVRSQSFGAISYDWDFGDGGFGNGMIYNHTFINTGAMDSIYQVRLVAQSLYNCNDTAYQDVLVRPTPIPDFTATPTTQTFPNSTVNLVNQSNPGNWDFEWDFMDSTFSVLRDPGSHTYSTWGKYWIELKASTQYCANSTEKLIEIKVPVPIADFKDTASGCAPLEVAFQNLSQYGRAYEWDFGDGGSSSLENPVYTYYQSGVYTVSLKVYGFENGLEDYIQKPIYINVFQTPTAGFFLNKEKVFVPNDPLVLSNTSRNADSYLWDFGDGNSSTQNSPVHYYQEKGEYFIQLIANSNNGCSDTFKLNVPVVAEGVGSLEVPNAFTPNKHGSNGGKVVSNASRDIMNDVFYAKIRGAVKYELNIFNKWGELLFVSNDVNIGWDGYYRGELCQQDTYVWKVKAEFVDGTSVEKVGDLLLLR